MSDNETLVDASYQSSAISAIGLQFIGSNDLSHWLLVTFAVLLSVNCVRKLITFLNFQSKLTSLPHEPYYPITGHIHRFGITLTTLTNLPEAAIMNECERLFTKYRDRGLILVKLMWKPFVLIFNHTIIRAIAAKNGLVERGGQIYLLKPWIGNSVTTSVAHLWYAKRRAINAAFQAECLPVYTAMVERQTLKLVEKLNNDEIISNPVNLSHWVPLAGLGYIVEIISGQFIDFLNSQGSQYVKDLDEIQQAREARLWFPVYSSEFIFSLTPSGRRHKAALTRVHHFSQSLVESCLDSMKQGKVNHGPVKPIVELVVQNYWEKAKLSGSKTIDVKAIREELDGLIMGTFDTTPNAISMTLYLLGLNPSCQEQLFQELNELDRNPETGIPDSADIMKLPYLDGVVKEGLRLYPPVPFVQRELDSEVTVDGNTIPAGINVTFCIYFLHRDPSVFPEPESFYPERWTQASQPIPTSSYLPFGFGLRQCVGKKLGQIISKIAIAHIILNFKLTSSKPLTSSDVKLSNALVSKIPLLVKLERRKETNNN